MRARRHSFPGNASSIFEQEEGIARKWRMRPHPYHRSDLLSLFRWLMQHNNRHTIIYYFGSSIHVRDGDGDGRRRRMAAGGGFMHYLLLNY